VAFVQQQPLVSVILPTFNRLQFLPAAIDSVFAQTYEHWELVIADDGSNDETREYLRRLEASPRVKLVWLAHTGNPAIVRNAGLRVARGEYVAFLDSDDFWLPRKLQLQIAAMRAQPTRQWSYTALTRVDEAGQPLEARSGGRFVPHEGSIVMQLLSWQACVATPTVMARRRLLEACGGFDERQGQMEDYEMWLRLALQSDVAVLVEPLTCVRVHRDHFSVNGIPAVLAKRRLIENKLTSIDDPVIRDVLWAELSKNSVTLAVANSAARDGRAARRMLASSWSYSWWRGGWWWGATKALLRFVMPDSLAMAVRRRIRPVTWPARERGPLQP
jgi:glycosyltransferase involved in cell wall biosynthesis